MSSSGCWKFSSSRFCCALVLNWCFHSWQAAVFKAHEHELQHELGYSSYFQRRLLLQASDWLNSFVDGGEETQKRVDQLGFPSNGVSNPSSFTLYIGLSDVCDTVIIKNFLINPKPFVCWTARFKRDLCCRRAKLHDWKMMTEFLLDLRNCTTSCVALSMHSVGQPAAERATAVQRLDLTHFYCPLVTLKRKSDDLIFAWSRKLHNRQHNRPRGTLHAQCGAASWWEGHSSFEDWTQHTFIAHSHLETVRLGAEKADQHTW